MRPYLELLRPANVATALGDVLAGFAIAQGADVALLPWLAGASVCLYAGGVVLNDVFDRHLDARERPERPLPSGRVTPGRAAAFGAAFLAAGVGAAAAAGGAALPVGAWLVAAILAYDALLKRSMLFGPLAMGACRGLNLAVGMAADPAALGTFWPLCFIPGVYVAGITLLSRGEVAGGGQWQARLSTGLVGAAAAALAAVVAVQQHAWAGLALTLLFAARVLPAFAHALRSPTPPAIRAAVKTGVLSLILLDAALAAAFAGLGFGLALLAVSFIAGWIARSFAVT